LSSPGAFDWEAGERCHSVVGYMVERPASAPGFYAPIGTKPSSPAPSLKPAQAFCDLEFLGWAGGDALFEFLEPWRGDVLAGLGRCRWVFFSGRELKCEGAVVVGHTFRMLTGFCGVNDVLDEVLG
jgi:hypothetical protein